MDKKKRLLVLVSSAIERGTAGIRCARRQNYYQFSMEEKQMLDRVGEILPLCACLGLGEIIQQARQALLQIAAAKEAQDYILTADYYELLFLPVLNRILEVGRQWQVPQNYWEFNSKILKEQYPLLYDRLSTLKVENILAERIYQPEDTMSGDKTLLLKRNHKKIYFHSNNNPKEEARQLAEAVYEECNTVYHILGLGFGYLPEALLSMDTSSRFVVYEGDLNIIRLMCEYRDCENLLRNRRIELVYDKGYQLFLPHLREGHVVFHEPSLHNIEDRKEHEKIYDYFITIQSAINNRKAMKENFVCNIVQNDKSVEVLKEAIEGKQVYLVAGGPSLDKVLESLKTRAKDTLLVCVGTSVKKLKAAGIQIDYMIVTDPMPWIGEQTEESEETPLWYLSTCFYGVRNQVKQGYLILQEGYAPAEAYGKKKGLQLYATGGSVTTTALEILLSMKCKRIVCMGMDMAYTENKSHASETAMERIISEEQKKHLISVKGIGRKEVYAPKNLTIYRKWIEQRVNRVSVTELVNVSDGAYIEGMKNISTTEWNKGENREE